MNQRVFFNRVSNSGRDIISEFIGLLENNKISYCVIGGIGINAYCQPIVTLDFDCVVAIKNIPKLRGYLRTAGFKLKKHPHTIEIKSPYSDLRIHIQTDNRYEKFLKNAKYHNILGYRIKVASKEDILQGKIWAYLDPQRAKLKREKDLLDIKRLIEKFPKLKKLIPEEIKNLVEI